VIQFLTGVTLGIIARVLWEAIDTYRELRRWEP
jgi:hypothetical protein